MSEQKRPSLKVNPTINLLESNSPLKPHPSSFPDPMRMLNRQLSRNPNAILGGYFRKLSNQLKSKDMTVHDFLMVMGQATYSLEDLSASLQANGFPYVQNEIEAVFNLISKEGQLEAKTLQHQLEKFAMDSNSDVSSDISSPRSNNSFSDILNSDWTENENTKDAIEMFSIRLRSSPKHLFETRLDALDDEVRIEDLNNLFLEKEYRVEEGVERNLLCAYFMGGFKLAPKTDVVNRFLNEFYWYEERLCGNEIDNVKRILASHQDQILAACTDADKGLREYITWKSLSQIILGFETMNPEELFELKCKCYSYENNLYRIPYKILLNELV